MSQNDNQGVNSELKTLKSQNDDLQFLATQKDKKIKDLELQVMEMRQKLSDALEATKYQKSTEIQKVFNHVKDADDYRARFDITNPLKTQDSGGLASAHTNAGNIDPEQREIWAQELEKVEGRC